MLVIRCAAWSFEHGADFFGEPAAFDLPPSREDESTEATEVLVAVADLPEFVVKLLIILGPVAVLRLVVGSHLLKHLQALITTSLDVAQPFKAGRVVGAGIEAYSHLNALL